VLVTDKKSDDKNCNNKEEDDMLIETPPTLIEAI
jgi:hypothetical protein